MKSVIFENNNTATLNRSDFFNLNYELLFINPISRNVYIVLRIIEILLLLPIPIFLYLKDEDLFTFIQEQNNQLFLEVI